MRLIVLLLVVLQESVPLMSSDIPDFGIERPDRKEEPEGILVCYIVKKKTKKIPFYVS